MEWNGALFWGRTWPPSDGLWRITILSPLDDEMEMGEHANTKRQAISAIATVHSQCLFLSPSPSISALKTSQPPPISSPLKPKTLSPPPSLRKTYPSVYSHSAIVVSQSSYTYAIQTRREESPFQTPPDCFGAVALPVIRSAERNAVFGAAVVGVVHWAVREEEETYGVLVSRGAPPCRFQLWRSLLYVAWSSIRECWCPPLLWPLS